MKRFLIKIVIFFLAILVIDFSFGQICNYIVSKYQRDDEGRIDFVCNENKSDIIIFGSSRAHHHYIPSIFEDSLQKSCYNAGVDGNGIILAEGLYDIMIKRYQPQLIIYDVEPAFDIKIYKDDNNRTRYLNPLKRYYNDSSIKKIFLDISPNEFIKSHSGLYRYNSSWLKNILGSQSYKENKGYSPMHGAMKDESKMMPNNIEVIETDTVKLKYLQHFIQAISKKGIPLLLIASPKYGAKSNHIFDIVKSYCKECKVPFIDMYKDHHYQKELFSEPMHLNDEGAKKYSQELTSKIKELHIWD